MIKFSFQFMWRLLNLSEFISVKMLSEDIEHLWSSNALVAMEAAFLAWFDQFFFKQVTW